MNSIFQFYSLSMQVVTHLPSSLAITLTKDERIKTNEKPLVIPAKKYYSYALTSLFLRDVKNYEEKEKIIFKEDGTEEEKEILTSAEQIMDKLKFLFPDAI